ncbi:hypothetical protein scyTo_0027106, partial [Scyliorhinus torazame]|nr:hypothetical protein [Scyliorhinus torazame]
LVDEESRVHSTLLEFGRFPDSFIKYGYSKQSNTEKSEDKKGALGTGLTTVATDISEEDDLQAVKELCIKKLMTGMAVMATEEGKLTASTVGHIVGLQSEEIKQFASEYAEKQSEFSAKERPERLGAAQQYRRQVASLNKQILQKSKQLEELQVKYGGIQATCEEAKKKLVEVVNYGQKLDKELSTVEAAESQADSSILEKLRSLVTMNEGLKDQELKFGNHCREEMARLQQVIKSLKGVAGTEEAEEKEHSALIEQQHKEDREKLQKIRLLLARQNREIASLG